MLIYLLCDLVKKWVIEFSSDQGTIRLGDDPVLVIVVDNVFLLTKRVKLLLFS